MMSRSHTKGDRRKIPKRIFCSKPGARRLKMKGGRRCDDKFMG